MSTPRPFLLTWLTVLARLGPLNEKWDRLLGNRIGAPPADRCPTLLGEVLQAVPLERRSALVLQNSLIGGVTSSTQTADGEVVFEWRATSATESWWYLGSYPTEDVLEAVLDAVRVWSALPAMPAKKDLPPGTFIQPHGRFPFQRVRETFEQWSEQWADEGKDAMVRAGLQKLSLEEGTDQTIITALLEMVPVAET